MLDTLLARLAEATLSPNVIATLIGATAALLAAFIQLRISWRRDQARPRKPQEPARPRRAPLLWMIVLAGAAAVGGFAAAMFLIGRGLGDADEIRAELRQRVAQLTATAERFEKAAPASAVPAPSAAAVATPAPAPATLESLAAITVAPCRLRVVEPPAAAAQPCSENDALRVALCATVPAHADALKVTTFVRSEDSVAAWADSRVPMGQDVGFAKFADQIYERTDGGERRVCVGFWSWHPDRAQTARLAVEFTPAAQAK
jgi:hypothetical protein